MPDDLPIYSETPLRTGLQFAGLDKLKGTETAAAWKRADDRIAALENATNVTAARQNFADVSRDELVSLHAKLFSHLSEAGLLRQQPVTPQYRGQDCAPPEFIERSLDNMHVWVSSESFQQIHPIEQCSLVIARIVDIWPFASGNLTVALVAGNCLLKRGRLAPFSVTGSQRPELEKVVAQAMTIDMQPLINAVYRTVKKEMEASAGR
jgi:fido (protein-threonine AMPylation protein)